LRAKIALVTGASRGIGRQIALDLSKTGIYTICVARPSESLERLNKELQGLPGSGRTIAMNLDSENAATSLVDLIDEPIDIIIHNVGGNLGLTNPLGGSSEFLRVIAHNMALSIDLNAHFIPKMQERGWGRVCHISSISALENQGPPSYSAAKASINSYVRGLGRYVAKDGVVVTCLMPGAILTEGGYWDQAMRERPEHVQKFIADRMAIGRLGNVSEISNVAMFLVSDASSFMTGSCVLVDGGQGRVIQMVEQA
jgi:3-oxoacyl-[acyl-carrier protein] reductase